MGTLPLKVIMFVLSHPTSKLLSQRQAVTKNSATITTSFGNCTFTQCSVAGDSNGGGAISAQIAAGDTLTFASLTINKCQAATGSAGGSDAKGRGGGSYLHLLALTAGYDVRNDFFGTDGNANSATDGKNLFIYSSDLSLSATNETLFSVDNNSTAQQEYDGTAVNAT